jgi:hypothetical protein
MAEMPGSESCRASRTGVGVLDSRGSTALAVTEAALSTFIAFWRMVEVFSYSSHFSRAMVKREERAGDAQ